MFTSRLAIATALAAALAAPAVAQGTIQDKMETMKPASEVGGQNLGILECEIEGGWGAFLGSSKAVTCTFENRDGTVQTYTGSMDKIGLTPDEWKAEVLDRRDNQMAERVILRLDGPAGCRLVFKFVLRPVDPEWFGLNIRAQEKAWAAYPEGVPVDFDNQACLMKFGHTDTLRDRLESASGQEQVALMQRAGAWLNEYHRRLPGEEKDFRPAAKMRLLENRIEETRAGTHPVIEQDRFLRVASAFLSERRRYWGRTVTARALGDMKLENLLIGDNVMGIDFMGRKVVPVGHDIGRLLNFYAISFAPRAVLKPGEVLPDEVVKGFFSAYSLVGPEDPCVQVVLRQRILVEWWSLPVPEKGEKPTPYARQVLSLATNVFEAGRNSIWNRLYPKIARATR